MMNKDNRMVCFSRRIKCLLSAVVFALLLTGFVASGVYADSGTKQASLTLIRKDGVFFDFRKEAGQKLYKYDTLQGACANEGYFYLTLYNRNVEKCRIVKVRIDDLKVVKVSRPLAVYHANSLTYNTRKDLIVAACCQVKGKRAVFVDPESLKVVGKKEIRLTKKIPRKVRKKYRGFTAIAYNEKHDCYIGRLRDDNNVIVFNGSLKPLRYVKLVGKKAFLLNQSMDSAGDYIYDVRSFKGKHKYSMVTIHTLNGRKVGALKFAFGHSPGNELQCIFHDGGRFYAGFYYTTSQRHDNKKHHVRRTNTLYKLNNIV
jgi:hypothetical protein